MNNKLIGFTTELEEHVNLYAKDKKMNFSEAVRFLVEKGLGLHISPDGESKEGEGIDIVTLWKEVQKLQKETGWFKADDTQSRLGNAELKIKELEKKINVLSSASKLFKKHIEDKEIHNG